MKNTLYILSFIFFVSCNDFPEIQNDLSELDLKGEVKSMIEYSTPKSHRYWEHKDFEYHFDSLGFVQKKTKYVFNSYKIFEFNDNHKVIETNLFDSKDSLIFKNKFIYQDKKLSNQEVFNSENEIVNTVAYEYSKLPDGNIIVDEKGYNSKGDLIHHTTNTQNQNGQDLKWSEFDPKGQLKFTDYLTYNESGKIVEYVKKDSMGNLKWKWNKTYNSKNLETERKLYNPKLDKETIRISTYEYDKQGNWVVKNLIQNKDTLKTFFRKIQYY
jgi:hypothetical protein